MTQSVIETVQSTFVKTKHLSGLYFASIHRLCPTMRPRRSARLSDEAVVKDDNERSQKRRRVDDIDELDLLPRAGPSNQPPPDTSFSDSLLPTTANSSAMPEYSTQITPAMVKAQERAAKAAERARVKAEKEAIKAETRRIKEEQRQIKEEQRRVKAAMIEAKRAAKAEKEARLGRLRTAAPQATIDRSEYDFGIADGSATRHDSTHVYG